MVPGSVVPPPGTRSDLARELFRGRELRRPKGVIPVVRPSATDLAAPPADGVRLGWLGHATVLLEIEGRRVLFDPLWSQRCSPLSLVGPRRLHPMPLALTDLPPLDAVVISHDHYDHLDMPTVRRLAAITKAPFVVPLGVGAHLERWGIDPERVVELDWDEHTDVGGLRLTATAARHFSGRLRQDNSTLWASWVVAGPTRRVFYTGDSGFFDDYAVIGAQHGPFDATLVQIGAYSPYWPDIHMTPEEGVAAHLEDELPTVYARPFSATLTRSFDELTDASRDVLAVTSVLGSPVPRGSVRSSGVSVGNVPTPSMRIGAPGRSCFARARRTWLTGPSHAFVRM